MRHRSLSPADVPRRQLRPPFAIVLLVAALTACQIKDAEFFTPLPTETRTDTGGSKPMPMFIGEVPSSSLGLGPFARLGRRFLGPEIGAVLHAQTVGAA